MWQTVGRLATVLGLLAPVECAVGATAAHAQAASSCDYATGTTAPGGGVDASGLCWFDFSDYSQAEAGSASGQQFTVSLGSGYTATFTLKDETVGNFANPGVTGEPTTSSINGGSGICGAAGGFEYESAPGNPRLYSNCAGLVIDTPKATRLTISGFSVTDPVGNPVTGYTLVTDDAESTEQMVDENETWASDVPLTLLDDSVAVSGRQCATPPSGVGTTSVTCNPVSPISTGHEPVLKAVNATTISYEEQTVSREAVMFGIETARVRLDKMVTGRVNAADSFSTSVTDPESAVIGSASTGANASSTTDSMTVVPLTDTSDAYTLAETGDTGTDLADYSQSWSCSNATEGSATVLPSGSGTSHTIDPAVGDDITCALTNSPASLSVVKSASPSSVSYVGQAVDYSYVVTNTGSLTLDNVGVSDTQTLPAGALASGPTCPAPTLVPSASETCTGTYTVTQADLNNGSVADSATATGTPVSGAPVTSAPSTTSVPATQTPALTVVKSASPSSFSKAGEVIVDSFLVTNTGNVTLSDVTVSDVQAPPAGALTSGPTCPTPTLAPGASETCTGAYRVTQADLKNGKETDTATAAGDPPGSDTRVESAPSTVTAGVTVASPAPSTVIIREVVPVTG